MQMTKETKDLLNSKGMQDLKDWENLKDSAIKYDLSFDFENGVCMHQLGDKQIVGIFNTNIEIYQKIGEVDKDNTYESIVVDYFFKEVENPIEELAIINIEFLKEAINEGKVNKYALATDKLTDDFILEFLANDEDPSIRRTLTLREYLPETILETLANDYQINVRNAVASREDLPSSLIEKLAEDENKYVRRTIAQRDDLSQDLVAKLANDESEVVRSAIAGRKDLSDELVEKLANDKSEEVRQSIKTNPYIKREKTKELVM
ncbi:HEAT repeat domain-containing protein [Taylorella equigenitalis]|uniref:Leucine rich repeat variant n=3 Tax=Taylorella equigenitalis TaxID=29575 RepID=A0A654KF92_TAYEM|nr:HEAT repeat domain-containing protein [Taylorella equigenitalis]ADU91081.1 leucine rich repeat variant [Taylorella equigenitalis MCE9]VEG31929.1 Leucine rich repeat variant [Taylorella equigenitalis ATCC 35865]